MLLSLDERLQRMIAFKRPTDVCPNQRLLVSSVQLFLLFWSVTLAIALFLFSSQLVLSVTPTTALFLSLLLLEVSATMLFQFSLPLAA